MSGFDLTVNHVEKSGAVLVAFESYMSQNRGGQKATHEELSKHTMARFAREVEKTRQFGTEKLEGVGIRADLPEWRNW